MSRAPSFDRRRFLALAGGGALFLAGCSQDRESTSRVNGSAVTIGPGDPAVTKLERQRAGTGSKVTRYTLRAAESTIALGPRKVKTWAYGDVMPGPELRVTQGDTLEVALRNDLPEATTIHWHGLALRNDMDGVPDLTQPSIAPGESFTYRFVTAQAGSYWFHPHMGLQLDRALYAPLVVEERDGAGDYDVDQVVVLDDWLDGIDSTPEETFKALTSMTSMGSMGGMGDMGSGRWAPAAWGPMA